MERPDIERTIETDKELYVQYELHVQDSTFKTYGYKFDEQGNVVDNDRTEWSYGRFGIFQGYSSSFSYTFNNDTWKKVKAFFTGEKEEGEGKEGGEGTETDETTEGEETASGGLPSKKKTEKAAVDEDGYMAFKMPWSINVNYGFGITEDRSHCFSMSASLSPFGRWKYYNFTIRANASILQDLKWEQRSQTQSNIQWY